MLLLLKILTNCVLAKSSENLILSNGPNILMVVVDDLRRFPAKEDVIFKNIHTLAENGANFKNAYSQLALCAPSRNSFLTSRRPDSLKLYDVHSYWREFAGNFTTIPQYFKELGYYTYSVGKVFHPGRSSNFNDDYPISWSIPPYHPSSERYRNSPVCREGNSTVYENNLICPVEIEQQPEKTLPDIQILNESIKFIKSRKDKGNPYFLVVGFHKPHIPFKFPAEYLSYHHLSKIKMARYPYRPFDLPLVAWHPWLDIKQRHDIKSLNISFPFGYMDDKWAKKTIQAYLASLSYIDDLIGQLLKHIDKEKTYIVLTSDHGWSMGENGMWAKYSNFDNSLRVPLIITGPNLKRKKINSPVELLDIFPTLVELITERKIDACNNAITILCTEGKSLVPFIFGNEKLHQKNVALSQFPRPSIYPRKNSDQPSLKDIKIMGYTIRDHRYRYTEWISFDNKYFCGNWSHVLGVEFYDHRIDVEESLNLYKRPDFLKLVKHYGTLLRKLNNNCIK